MSYVSTYSIGEVEDSDPRIWRLNCMVVSCEVARPDCTLPAESCTRLAES